MLTVAIMTGPQEIDLSLTYIANIFLDLLN